MAPEVRAQNFEIKILIWDAAARRITGRPIGNTGPTVSNRYVAGMLSVMLRNAGLLDYRRPFGDIALHALRHRFGCAAAHLHAQLAYLLLDIGPRQDFVDGPGEDLDDRAGRRSGHGNPVPTHDFKVFDTAFLDGRNGRQIGRSLSAGGSHGDDFVVRDLPAYCGIELEGDIDIATQKRGVLPGLMVAIFSLPGFTRAILTMSSTDCSGEP